MNWKIGDRLADPATPAATDAQDVGAGRVGGGSAVAVHVEGVSKRYGSGNHSLLALDGIDVTIGDGEIVALLGPSGCGKSTLLKVLGGLYPVTSGRVVLHGNEIDGPSPLVGFMFQTPVLFPWLSVLDNTLLPIRVNRDSVRRHAPKAKEFIEMVGLSGFEDRHPWELSGGMQQRAAICRMLMADPAVLLLDEPFGALDELTREYMDMEIRSIITSTRKTAVFVTHSVPEAVFLSDRVVVLSPRPGRVAGDVRIDLGDERKGDLFASDELLAGVREVREILERSGGVEQR